MNILITGSSGQLGSAFKNIKPKKKQYYFFCNKSDLNIGSLISLEKYILKNKIDTLVNCAAYTSVENAHKFKKICNRINNLYCANLAKVCKKLDVLLIHISTDFVYHSKNKYFFSEKDKTNPLSYYGKTKLKGEIQIGKIHKKSIIIRTSWLYSEYGNNFLVSILNKIKNTKNINIFFNSFGSPTYAFDLANDISKILSKKNILTKINKSQIFNYNNTGCTDRYSFTKKIIKKINNNIIVTKIPDEKINLIIKRPENSCMDNSLFSKYFNIKINKWDSSLNTCIENILKNDNNLLDLNSKN